MIINQRVQLHTAQLLTLPEEFLYQEVFVSLTVASLV